MKMIARCGVLGILAGGLFVAGAARAAETVESLQKEALAAVESFQQADSTLAGPLGKAAGYAVFPRIAKGGLVVGAAHGTGVVFEKGKLVGKATVAQGTFGAQIGGQVFRELILFETAAALEAFKESRFEMNAQAGAVAAAEGVARNAKFTEGVLVVTQPIKGLMAEATVGGQKFTFEAVK